jgi:hypothetical protein
MFGEPLDQYFGVGARLIYMRQAREKLPIHGQGFAKNVIELFLQDIARFPMPVTRQTSQPLRDFLKSIQGRAAGSVLSANEAKDLVKIARDITPTFEAESRSIMTVVLLEKRFDIGKLMSGVPTLLSKGVFEALPEVAQTDMNEAGKCLALNRATAAAFHSLRATEAMLKKLYFQIVRQKRLKTPMWAAMVDALRKRTKGNPSDELLDLLDGIRRNYRNPTQHPSKVYDIDEAQDLFGQCLAAQNLIYKTLRGA